MSQQVNEDLVGTCLSERYRLDSVIGQGSMGEVYLANDTLLGRNVAIKVLANYFPGRENRSRLYQEAQSAAQLNHPNIVTIFDVGEYDDLPFIVMELVEGTTLHDNQPDDLDKILSIFVEICAALQHAHTKGIIHRDVKPENVLIDKDGQARLMDFGIARSTASRLTQQGLFLGTVHYIAPEQALGEEMDHRADLYSFGVMLYEFVSGRLPFDAEDPLVVITQHLHAPLVPPSAWVDDIPPDLDTLIQRLMAREPDDRPGSAAEVFEILNNIKTNIEGPTSGTAHINELSALDRVASGRIVGRSDELAKARSFWQKAIEGQGQLLLVSGEPGVGKTRLVQELITQTKVTHGLALVGASYAEWGPPYDPFRQVILQALRDPIIKHVDLPEKVKQDLIRIAPELRLENPGFSEIPQEGSNSEPGNLINSLIFFFKQLSKIVPTLLVLEDVHWADSSSLALLRQLARNMRQSKLFIVATYREVELHEAQYLHEVLLDFNREKLDTRLKLSRLDRNGTQDLLAFLFTDEITPDFLDGIYHETEGNPFFIEEVCKALVESGKVYYREGRWHRPGIDELGIPQSIQVAIQSRLKVLPDECQNVLTQAAVIGRDFDFDTLHEAVELEENVLVDSLEDALSAKLLSETGNDQGGEYAFVHALIPGTLVASLRSLRRSKLHLRAAKAIESVHPQSYEALAYQFVEAGQMDKGVAYLIKAGDRARDLYAYEDAIRNYVQASEHLKDEGEPQDVARILMKLGLVFHSTFQYEKSRQAYQEGFDYWQQAEKRQKIEQLQPAPHALRSFIGEPKSLDPGLNDDGWSDHILVNIFSGLVELDSNFDIVPDIAYRWEVLEDGRRYLFYLRDNVTWSDGVSVTAYDFEFAWKRALDPKIGSVKANTLFPIKKAREFHQGREEDPDQIGIHASDRLLLEVELERPDSSFLYILSESVSFPVPRHIVQKCGADWTELEFLVTNGPFQISEWRRGEFIELVKNPSYHKETGGNLSEITMYFFEQSIDDLLSLYQDDQLDFIWLGYASDFPRARFQFAEDYRSSPFLMTFYFSFDTRRPPFNDRRVRQAIAHGLDREYLVNEAYEGRFYPATGGLLPSGMMGNVDGIALPYNPQKAKQLLAEAGYPGGKGFPEIEWLIGRTLTSEKIQKIIDSQLTENLALRIKWKKLSGWEFDQQLADNKPHIYGQGTFAAYPDPEEFLRPSFITRLSGWRDQEYDQLIIQARETMDPQKREQLYRRADQMLIDQLPILPFGYSRFNALIKPWVTRFPFSPTRGWFWKEVIIEDH